MHKEVIYAFILFILVSFAYAQEYNKIGDEIDVSGQKVTIRDIGLRDVLVDVDGDFEDISLNATKLVNGVNITVNDIFYHSAPSSRLVWLTLVFVFTTVDQCSSNIECDDNDPCTIDKCTGSPRRCDYDDSHFKVNYCLNNDGCCAVEYCNFVYDNDCPIEPKCIDDDDCRADRDVCTQAQCVDGICKQAEITECIHGDYCCPDGCFHSLQSDQDCSSKNKCTWNTECNDDNPCTVDICEENSDGVKACVSIKQESCIDNDGCCAAECTYATDYDCTYTLGLEGPVVAQKPEGTLCVYDSECKDGTCIEGTCTSVTVAESLFDILINFFKRLFFIRGQA